VPVQVKKKDREEKSMIAIQRKQLVQDVAKESIFAATAMVQNRPQEFGAVETVVTPADVVNEAFAIGEAFAAKVEAMEAASGDEAQ